MRPRFPIYIPSKGRHDSRLTIRHLETMGVPFHVIVEAQEFLLYASVVDRSKILVLDPAYQRDYDACMPLTPTQSRGSGPARNFAWDHAVAAKADCHWIIDDNINGFFRLHNNLPVIVNDGAFFRCMEDFCLRYTNVAMAGPNYRWLAKRKQKLPPFVLNTKVYSCNLIRNDVPFRWRGRYNEDVDLSLRMLKASYCTVQFNAFLQDKMTTQAMPGGNTDAFYAKEGTLPKSQMLARLHPDVATVVWKFGRWHHHVDYRPFRATKLIRKPNLDISEAPDNYGMRLIQLEKPTRHARETLRQPS